MHYYEGFLPYLLISNSHPNTSERLALAEIMLDMGYRNVYFTFGYPNDWQWFAGHHFENPLCSAVVAIIDEAYLKSDYCRAELSLAKVNKLPIVALFVDDTPIPDSFRPLLEDAVSFYCNSLAAKDVAFLKELECISHCLCRTPLVPPDPDFEINSDVLVKGLVEKPSITIPEGITTLGNSAFKRHKTLTEVHLPTSLKKIGISAFLDCQKLTSIVIPETVKEVAFWAFYNCIELREVTLLGEVETFHASAFDGCVNLKTIYIRGTARPPKCNLPQNTRIVRI